MPDRDRPLSRLLDYYYCEQQALAARVNQRPAGEALSDPACYTAVHDLAHEQARTLGEQVDRAGQTHVAHTLQQHPLEHEMLLQSAFIRHALEKPRGDAGDMDLMRMICTFEDHGETNFAVLENRVYLNLPAAEAVRQRVASLFEWFKELPDGSRVLNLACGPAVEVDEYIRQQPGRALHFELLDHDWQTVRYVRQRIDPRRAECRLGNALQIIRGNYQTVLPRHAFMATCDPERDFRGWRTYLTPLKYTRGTLRPASYDLVYSTGLFDYIKTFPGDKTKGTVALTRRLFDLVKPGGTLIVGNYLAQSASNPHLRPHRLMMELYSDWYLFYRTPEEIIDFLADLPVNGYSVQLTHEYFGQNQQTERGAIGFLIINKN